MVSSSPGVPWHSGAGGCMVDFTVLSFLFGRRSLCMSDSVPTTCVRDDGGGRKISFARCTRVGCLACFATERRAARSWQAGIGVVQIPNGREQRCVQRFFSRRKAEKLWLSAHMV